MWEKDMPLSREQMLALKPSVKSWIILRDYINNHPDLDAYKKIISDYKSECPIWEMARIIGQASRYFLFSQNELQQILDCVFQDPRLNVEQSITYKRNEQGEKKEDEKYEQPD